MGKSWQLVEKHHHRRNEKKKAIGSYAARLRRSEGWQMSAKKQRLATARHLQPCVSQGGDAGMMNMR
jgi:hypothetical protein